MVVTQKDRVDLQKLDDAFPGLLDGSMSLTLLREE